jgi:hypothetical protein
VKRDRRQELRVLHIDEKAYSASVHGGLGCRSCHAKIWTVPHVGARAVECTVRCHQEDRRRISNLPLAGFHHEEQSYITRLEDGSSCRVCHPMYPHSEDEVVRTFLNMHTGFARCEVCHIDREEFPPITHDWETSRDVEFSGPSFGSYYDPRVRRTRRARDELSRIAVRFAQASSSALTIAAQDAEEAVEFARAEGILDEERRTERLAHFHRHVVRREISVACKDCHSPSGILDYRKLGFAAPHENALKHLNLIGIVTKYETFHLPKLF